MGVLMLASPLCFSGQPFQAGRVRVPPSPQLRLVLPSNRLGPLFLMSSRSCPLQFGAALPSPSQRATKLEYVRLMWRLGGRSLALQFRCGRSLALRCVRGLALHFRCGRSLAFQVRAQPVIRRSHRPAPRPRLVPLALVRLPVPPKAHSETSWRGASVRWARGRARLGSPEAQVGGDVLVLLGQNRTAPCFSCSLLELRS